MKSLQKVGQKEIDQHHQAVNNHPDEHQVQPQRQNGFEPGPVRPGYFSETIREHDRHPAQYQAFDNQTQKQFPPAEEIGQIQKMTGVMTESSETVFSEQGHPGTDKGIKNRREKIIMGV